ncbi:hypothetical protein MKS88_000629 [Plasmodium brasilianum]|uniref:Uncharacterized protein n=1 Tax=Plasmodium brasilianum TaxID=5824 RepID=A0ACB9YEG9_PLABR|nr:hypothetical protein MKS88_000629 [Plasmodium brasilianum]
MEIAIEQYNRQQQLNRLIEEIENVENNYEIEETNVNMLLINLEELENKENHEELYRYKKEEKLQTKLRIFVLMTVLVECRKEDNLSNNDSHLDTCIKEWKREENSNEKLHISE